MKSFLDFHEDTKRVPRKKGQHQNSPSHSDLYTDENPKGTIHGLKFATAEDAKKSVSKIENSGKSHAHKIQAAIAMEQRARVMKKTEAAGVYRDYIDKMKKKTKEKNEEAPTSNTSALTGYAPPMQLVRRKKKKDMTYDGRTRNVKELVKRILTRREKRNAKKL